MRRSIPIALAGMFLVLGGCASTGGSRMTNSQYGPDVDVGKIIAVNQWAQTKGATVVWVNYPQKSKIAESTTPIN